MKVINMITEVDKKGHIKIDIPSDIQKGQVELVIIINSEKNENKLSKNKYNFSDVYGKLKWKGNALRVQKELRNEWN